MYMNCVFDANLKDNKRLYILQGHFLKRQKIIPNFTKINFGHGQLAMDFYEWPEYETFFLQLEFRWWTCKNNIDWHVFCNDMT